MKVCLKWKCLCCVVSLDSSGWKKFAVARTEFDTKNFRIKRTEFQKFKTGKKIWIKKTWIFNTSHEMFGAEHENGTKVLSKCLHVWKMYIYIHCTYTYVKQSLFTIRSNGMSWSIQSLSLHLTILKVHFGILYRIWLAYQKCQENRKTDHVKCATRKRNIVTTSKIFIITRNKFTLEQFTSQKHDASKKGELKPKKNRRIPFANRNKKKNKQFIPHIQLECWLAQLW